MTRHLRSLETLLAVEGLALVRRRLVGSDEEADRRLKEIREIAECSETSSLAACEELGELSVPDGYGRWAATYDVLDNPLISVEQPLVWALLESIPPGSALDAACGTGRHARHLAERGHEVTGVDMTPEMLAVARDKVPEGRFDLADVCDLPFTDSLFDLVLCALALDHVPDITGAFAELARVAQPGGRVVVSVMHPVLSILGAVACFRAMDGTCAFVSGHCHSHADYIDAFTANGLHLKRCIEGRFGHGEVRMQEPPITLFPEATQAAYLGLPAVLVWDMVRPASAARGD